MTSIKSATIRLNYLENMGKDFTGNKDVEYAIATLQLALAMMLVKRLEKKQEISSSSVFTETEHGYAESKQIIPIIKSVRERLNLGLKEARDYTIKHLTEFNYGVEDKTVGFSFRWYE